MKVQKIVILILFISLFSCSSEGRGNGRKGRFAGKHKKSNKEIVTPVEITHLSTGKIGSYILLNSTIETEQMIDVYAQASGFVEKIVAEEGQIVKQNDVLAKLDAREIQLRYEKALATFNKRKAEYERFQKNVNETVLSKEEIENIEYQYSLARIEKDEAKLALEYTEIRSPISGVVSLRDLKIGDRVDMGKKVYQITNLAELIAVVNVPEKKMGEIKKGQYVEVYSENLKENDKTIRFPAKVKRVSPVIDPMSGTFKVTVAIKNDPKLYAGAFVNVSIKIAEHENALLIPKSAIVYVNEEKFIYAVRDSIVKKLPVLGGFEDTYFVETLNKNISDGDSIVLLGKEGLKDAAKVRIVKDSMNNETPKSEKKKKNIKNKRAKRLANL
jgi:membrane fusion protein (multidrug efflux system)